MRHILFVVILIVAGCSVPKQDEIGTCVLNARSKEDSLMKVGKNPYEEWEKCVIGKPIPNLALKSISGEIVRTSKLKGKIVVMNFWFVGCAPCLAEMPGLNKLVDEYKNEQIEFLAISPEPADYIKEKFLSKHKLSFKIIPESMSIINRIMGSGYPTTYFINRKGIINEAYVGGVIDSTAGDVFFNKSKPIIDKLLAQ